MPSSLQFPAPRKCRRSPGRRQGSRNRWLARYLGPKRSAEGDALPALAALIDVGQFGVERGEVIDAGGEAFLMAAVEAADHLLDAVTRKEGIAAVVVVAIRGWCRAVGISHRRDFAQDADVVRNVEGVARVLVREQVVEIVEARPGDAAEAERAGLVRREEQAVLRRRTAFGGHLLVVFVVVVFV